jgi:hypothetical protein
LRLRGDAFEQAADWMRNAARQGGVAGPVTITFQDQALPRQHVDARVDVEIHRGNAFGYETLEP